MPNDLQTWQHTDIYRLLTGRSSPEAGEARRVLQTCLPHAEKILHSGGTASLDFTLHDELHSFRVAQRMIEVIPSSSVNDLSEMELALLLLAAYLHDIGMTPERGKVRQVFRYLKTGEEESLSEHEKRDIQEWLDNASAGAPGKLNSSNKVHGVDDTLELYVTHYCRHRHNEWSTEWIRENLNTVQWDGYVDWLDDLVELCRSHHYGYPELLKSQFDPKPLSGMSLGRIIHRRYLACVLRVADILDFDPERTPDVVFLHRSVVKSSEIFWHRDHYIQLLFDLGRTHVLLMAEPPNARVHRAVLDFADQVDAELTLCQRVSQQAPFDRLGPISNLAHKWDLPSVVDRKVVPKNEAYVYIDGAFRPNTQKLLQLLSGRELYGSHFAAVRELLQNAFDATKERIAREKLNAGTPISERSVASDQYTVDLRIQKDATGFLLVCQDQGVGMSKHIIEHYLLVSGSAMRHDILDLERRCDKVGLRLARTGEFGIGVLSYFMIATKVVIETQRDPSCGDSEANGWVFETDGVGSFGELRRARLSSIGTRVTLRLRPELCAEDPSRFAEDLKEYLSGNLVRIPCRFSLTSEFSNGSCAYGPGWTADQEILAARALSSLERKTSDSDESRKGLLSTSGRRRLEKKNQYWREVLNEAKAALRWRVISGELPDNAGAYRVSIPYFELDHGISFAFVRATETDGGLTVEKLSSGLAFIPQGHETNAWRGIRADSRTYHGITWRQYEGFGIREVDWEARDAGSVSVDRNKVQLSGKANNAARWVNQRVLEEYENIAAENSSSPFGWLNFRILDKPPSPSCSPQWRSEWKESSDTSTKWQAVTFPATVSQAFAYWNYPTELENNGRSVSVIPPLGELDDDDHYDGIGWNGSRLQPQRMLVYARHKTQLVPVWDQAPAAESFTTRPFLVSSFPENWPDFIGTQLENYSALHQGAVIWNREHPVVQLLNVDDWNCVAESIKPEVDPLMLADTILARPGRAAAWLALTIAESNKELWNGMAERDASFLDAVWRLAMSNATTSTDEIKFFVQDSNGVRVVSVRDWKFHLEISPWEEDKKPRVLDGDILPKVRELWLLDSPEIRGYRQVLRTGSSLKK